MAAYDAIRQKYEVLINGKISWGKKSCCPSLINNNIGCKSIFAQSHRKANSRDIETLIDRLCILPQWYWLLPRYELHCRIPLHKSGKRRKCLSYVWVPNGRKVQGTIR